MDGPRFSLEHFVIYNNQCFWYNVSVENNFKQLSATTKVKNVTNSGMPHCIYVYRFTRWKSNQ